MSPTVGLLVALGTLLNIAAVMWLLWWTRRRRDQGSATAGGAPDTTGHVWDGDLTEYNNPLPRWWLGLFILTVIFGLVYLVIYPGLGNFAGSKGWSQIEQYRQQTAEAEAVLARTFAPFEHREVTTLVEDPAAQRIGRNLYMNNCATCHGSDGRGAPGFPNLADDDWQWGGAPETVLETIGGGRTGVMAPWRDALGGDSGVEDVLAHVLGLSGRKVPAGDVARGRMKFEQLCTACHGADGRGNAQLGAPDLTDNVWVHGGSIAAVRESIANGRQGQMPAHLERLGETRVKLLAAYVLGLGQADGARAGAVTVAAARGAGAPDERRAP